MPGLPSAQRFEKALRSVLPSPFALALLLTGLVLLAAVFLLKPSPHLSFREHGLHMLHSWYSGLWSESMLVFAYQMMLILVLGHVLALSPPISRLMMKCIGHINSTAAAAFWLCLFCIVLGLINWGLALIFGAVFARKLGEHATENGLSFNYPLIAATGYTGMMVWHGGLSGSALIKAAEPGHLESLMAGSIGLGEIPNQLSLAETVFSGMNIFTSICLLLLLPALAFILGKTQKSSEKNLPLRETKEAEEAEASQDKQYMAERIDRHPLPVWLLGALCLAAAIMLSLYAPNGTKSSLAGPNLLNIIFLGLGLLAHGSLQSFLRALQQSMSGAAGILIQFPLYFGIMALMKESGLGAAISGFFVDISSPGSFAYLSFVSAGFVNVIVPSGGGQWMIQGPIIIEASQSMGIPLSKSVLAMAYGDQITNMLQPFWALPLLAITGLEARQILPYTLLYMLAGAAIFLLAMTVF